MKRMIIVLLFWAKLSDAQYIQDTVKTNFDDIDVYLINKRGSPIISGAYSEGIYHFDDIPNLSRSLFKVTGDSTIKSINIKIGSIDTIIYRRNDNIFILK